MLLTYFKKIISTTNKRDVFISCMVLLSIWVFYGAALLELFFANSAQSTLNQNSNRFIFVENLVSIYNNLYIRRIVSFSFFQALLSTILSIFFGVCAAHAIFHQQFFAKVWLVRILSLAMVLPVLVTVFGLLAVYGNSGWLTNLCQFLGIEWQPKIYGLTGILLAHVFLNMPLVAKLTLHTLSTTPFQQRRLANQLGITNWNFIRLIEWPHLRSQFPTLFVLIFMLCFTSFTVVLTLGGSPKYTTLEVAIYQALVFNFNYELATLLAFLQSGFCLLLFTISNYFTKSGDITENIQQNHESLPVFNKIWGYLHRFTLFVTILFIALPLISIIIKAFDLQAWQSSLSNSSLYTAIGFSISIAVSAAVLCLLMTSALLLGARQFQWLGFVKVANTIIGMGMMVFAIPTLVLAVGLFLWLQSVDVSTMLLFAIVVFCNALMCMPFALRLLAQPFFNNMSHYEKLCQSLNITGIARLKYIEWHALKKPIISAFALSAALSLGDFTAIALFGTQDFTSLPHLLYQQLSSYRHEQAAITAFILLVLCTIIFSFVESD